jgi:hypothetical protein
VQLDFKTLTPNDLLLYLIGILGLISGLQHFITLAQMHVLLHVASRVHITFVKVPSHFGLAPFGLALEVMSLTAINFDNLRCRIKNA